MSQETLLSFDAFIRHWAAVAPDAVALEEDEDRTSFAELDGRTRRAVALLAAHGVSKGDRVA
jgi:non-ribosomal peptide synthetase component E (peptide arylation enzyme)